MAKKSIDDELIQPYLGHETKKSLIEIYSKLPLAESQKVYDVIINKFPIK